MPSTIILSDNGATSGSAGLKTSGGNDGVLILQTTTSGGTATNAVYVDTSQNVGLGVTPSAWVSTFKSIDVSTYASFYGRTSAVTAGIASNAYQNSSGNWTYKANNYAAKYDVDTGQHVWWNAASGTAGNSISFTQAMTLDASGNLGVGTTSPVARVHARTGASSALSDSRYVVRAEGTSEAYLSAAGNDYVGVRFPSASSASQAYIDYYHGINSMLFGVNNSERMRIDSSGKFMVGTTTASGRVTIKPASNAYSEGLNLIASNSSNYWSQLVSTDNNLYFGYNGADKGYFNNSTGAYTTSSDERLKKNITNIQYGLNEVIALRPVAYNMNEQTDGETKALGFIAQEAMQVIPESVTEMMSGMYGMDKVALVPVLVKAIQEQQAIITQLQADVQALKGQA